MGVVNIHELQYEIKYGHCDYKDRLNQSMVAC